MLSRNGKKLATTTVLEIEKKDKEEKRSKRNEKTRKKKESR